MTHRAYDPKRDREAVERIWREVGWVDSDEAKKGLEVFLRSGRTLVSELDGEALRRRDELEDLLQYPVLTPLGIDGFFELGEDDLLGSTPGRDGNPRHHGQAQRQPGRPRPAALPGRHDYSSPTTKRRSMRRSR